MSIGPLNNGSSAIAVYDFGCDFVGCEIDEDYYDAARKRFENHKLQGKLVFEYHSEDILGMIK